MPSTKKERYATQHFTRRLCWPLGTSVLVFSVLRLIERAFLSKHAAEKYNQYGLEATPYGQTPTHLIRDNDRKYGPNCAREATTSGINVLRTPYRTPQANAVCERFLGSVRRVCLDYFLIFHEKQLSRLLKAYAMYFNQARPHQGLGQRIPEPPVLSVSASQQANKVIAVPVLGGLHHGYQRTA